MNLTLTTPTGEICTVQVPSDMTIGDLTALAQSSFPNINVQPTLLVNNNVLNSIMTSTLIQAGIHDNDLIVVVTPPQQSVLPSSSTRAPPTQSRVEMQQIVNQFWSKLAQQSPEQLAEMKRKAELQAKINENYALAMEYLPESFADVIMLYIKGKVNGHPIKAFVDSGAQRTIISEEFATQCQLTDLIDERYAGVAQGVGTAKMIGRVHAAQLEVNTDSEGGSLFLMCSFTVIEKGNNGVDMLLGLDMLKHHQAKIDLAKNALCIQNKHIPFLSEHELPDKAKRPNKGQSDLVEGRTGSKVPDPTSSHSVSQPAAAAAQPVPPSSSKEDVVDEEKVTLLLSMGAQRTNAIQALTAAKGNIELAVSILFDS